MKAYSKGRRRRKHRRRIDEETAAVGPVPAPTQAANRSESLGPHYKEGPVHTLSPEYDQMAAPSHEQEPGMAPEAGPASDERTQTEEKEASTHQSLPALKGRGEPEHVVAFNQRGPLRLQGRTDATYDGGQYHTENVTVQPGKDCTSCGRDCVHVTGTLVATYSVATTVTLPRVSDFPNLTPCQQARVQDAITNVLAPHEQQHVQAFRQYNGTTRRAFDLNLCRSEFNGAIQSMFAAEQSARRAAAQAASDALDPFHFDVDLNCAEPGATLEGAAEAGAAAVPPSD